MKKCCYVVMCDADGKSGRWEEKICKINKQGMRERKKSSKVVKNKEKEETRNKLAMIKTRNVEGGLKG